MVFIPLHYPDLVLALYVHMYIYIHIHKIELDFIFYPRAVAMRDEGMHYVLETDCLLLKCMNCISGLRLGIRDQGSCVSVSQMCK